MNKIDLYDIGLNDRFKNRDNYILLNTDILKLDIDDYVKNIEKASGWHEPKV